MTNYKESQPGGDVLAVCNALVFRFDGQTREWHETGGVSKLLLVRTPIVYQIDGRLESTGQVTIKVPLGQNSEYSNLDEDPTSYRLTISPQEVYIFRIARDGAGQAFSFVLQTVLRNLREKETRPVEPPSSPREAWVPQREAAPPSPSQPISEQLQTSSNLEHLCEELAEVIRQGDENTASEIVRVMAQEQVPLSIKMKNPKVVTVEHGKETIDLKVVVEDRETSGGAFVMKVFPSTKIQTLQEEVAERFGFPPKVQKWIIGKMMARPSNTLADCYVNKAGHTAFLYLISGKSAGLTKGEFERYVKRTEEGSFSALGQQIPNGTPVSIGVASPMPDTTLLSRTTSMPVLNTVGVPRTEGFASHSIAVQPPARQVNQSQPINQGEALNSRDQRIQSASDITAIQEELQREQAINLHSIPVEDTEEVQTAGWKCTACTYVNTPTRPGCEMCGGDRPDGYVVPENTMIREQERNRIAEERRQQELFEQALQQQEQEQAIARETNFLQLVQTAQQNLIKNTEEFDCAICYTTVLPEEGVVLRECLHSFCRDCLREHIRNCTDPEVQCPFQDNEFACHSLITAQEIKSLLSAEDFNKYLNRSLVTAESQAANSFHCKTPNCPGWCIYEDNSNIFHCPVCDKQNCLTCKAQHFPDMNCKEYQDDLKRRAQNDKAAQQTQQFLENMIAKGEAMKCPQCEIILLKKDGCDWMRCSMCRLEICWATRGPRWGPQGVGDISGGCKCRVGGKKCHPKCQNCH